MKVSPFIVLLLSISLLQSCTDDSTVTPPPTTPDAPFGVPDFTQAEYGWIDTVDKHCEDFANRLYWWNPKFYYQVADASPDGNKLLLLLSNRLGIYDINAQSLTTLAPGEYLGAQWSHSGRYVSASNKNGGTDEFVTIFDIQTHEKITPVKLPSNIVDISTIFRFFPGDTTFLIGASYFLGNVDEFKATSVSIHSPFLQRKVYTPNVKAPELKENNYYYIDGTGYNDQKGTYSEVQLRIGSLNDSIIQKSYKLDKINGIIKPDLRISPDGKWLAVQLSPDMSHTKYVNIPGLSVGGLAIIDLREGSSTQFKVYRFFPDYMKGGCNCANLQYTPGMAWSADGRYIYHQQIRISDSTTQIVRRDVRTGKTEEISNFLTSP